MTRKKNRETTLALETAERLGKRWRIDKIGESPDLLVCEDGQRFGREVTEIHAGHINRRGSKLKMEESSIDSALGALRRDYEAVARVPLRIQFLGDIGPDNRKWALTQLIASDLSSKKVGTSVELDNDIVLPFGEERRRPRVRATRSLRPQWTAVDTTVGFVDFNPMLRIAEAVAAKAKSINAYPETIVTDKLASYGAAILTRAELPQASANSYSLGGA